MGRATVTSDAVDIEPADAEISDGGLDSLAALLIDFVLNEVHAK